MGRVGGAGSVSPAGGGVRGQRHVDGSPLALGVRLAVGGVAVGGEDEEALPPDRLEAQLLPPASWTGS